MVKLKLKNESNLVLISQEDKKKYSELFAEIVNILDYFAKNASQTKIHLVYLAIVTLVVNDHEQST